MADLPLLRDPDAVELTGSVERVVFHNEENGYTVLRLLPDKALPGASRVTGAPPRAVSRDPVTCVGHMVSPQAGVHLRVAGRWVNNARFGRQVEFSGCEEMLPATSEGIRLYLASGLIKGVGEELAGRIVQAFGTDTIRVLDEEPERLLQVRGVGRKSLARIQESWAEHRGMRDLLLFLQPHGITPAYAVRIYRAYGSQALNVVRENPYRLAMDIHGIGFVTADAAAAKLGFEPDHPLRIQAGTLYILQKATDDGNVYLPEARLAREVCSQLNVEPEQALEAIAALELDERLVREELEAPGQAVPDETNAEDGEDGNEVGVYLRRYHHCETKTAFYLQRLLHSPKAVRFENPDALVDRIAGQLPIALAPEQLEAVRTAARSKIMVLTGGPGTGKTTIINAIIKLFGEVRARILPAAPTGRAAKRMAETSGREARTIHRLLEYSPKEDGFARNEDNPLACGLLVVDEAYMDFAEDESGASLLASGALPDNAAFLRTFSKSWGLAGLRLGYGVLPPALADYFWRARLPFSVNILAEEVGLAALADTAFRQATLDAVRQGRATLRDGLTALGCTVWPSAANFLLFQLPPGAGPARNCFEALLRRGIIIRPLSSYKLPEHLRVSVGDAAENAAFLTAMRDILAAPETAGHI